MTERYAGLSLVSRLRTALRPGATVAALVAVAAVALHRPARASDRVEARGAVAGDSDHLRRLDLAAIRAEIAKRRGRVVVLHLWASWCYPCIQEMGRIDAFARRLRARGGEVVSVSLDPPAGSAHAARALRELGPNLTRLIVSVDDPDTFAARLAPGWDGSIPALFAYQASGVLRKRAIGELEDRELAAWMATVLRWTQASGEASPTEKSPPEKSPVKSTPAKSTPAPSTRTKTPP